MHFRLPMHKFVVLGSRCLVGAEIAAAEEESRYQHADLLLELDPGIGSWEQAEIERWSSEVLAGWICGRGMRRQVALGEAAPDGRVEAAVRAGLAGWCAEQGVAELEFVESPYEGGA